MITKKTVLVLGAGASQPYDYPTGHELRMNICRELEHSSTTLSQRLQQFGYDYQTLKNFRDDLFESDEPSIDAFLEKRPKLIELGKLVITLALMESEISKNLFERKNWYSLLLGKLGTFDDFDKNRLSIITFNYDRSLDYFLFTTLSKRYPDKKEAEIVQKVQSIPIIHVYGQIGDLPWQNKSSFRFYDPSTFANQPAVQLSYKNIRIMHEIDTEKDPLFVKAREQLEQAEKIYFLGFGYHQMNIDRLHVKDWKVDGKEILGTSLGMTDREMNDTMKRCYNNITLRVLHAGSQDVITFLRHHVSFT